MNFATLLLIASTLVLKTGERIAVDGPIVTQGSVVLFRSGGALYSMPASEVDEVASRPTIETATDGPLTPRRLKLASAERQRLLRELEQNHGGSPAAELARPSGPPPREPSAPVADAEEWNWRQRARDHEEAVRQARENVELLQDRADRLRAEIRGLLALGWKPQSFTYQTTQLAYVEESLPGAELAVRRAQRAYTQFRDDARRQGVMPGWLR